MKSKILIPLFLVCVAFALTSFKKDAPPKKLDAISFFKVKRNINEYKKGNPRTEVVFNSADGNYYTSFGYGFGYGSTFTYPTSVLPGDDGTAWTPSCGFDGTYCGTYAYDYQQNDDSFSVSYAINPGYPYSAGAIETFTGHYVIDANSPTHVSIIFDSDVVTPF